MNIGEVSARLENIAYLYVGDDAVPKRNHSSKMELQFHFDPCHCHFSVIP